MKIERLPGGIWKVKSKYFVSVSGDCLTCTCKFYEKRGKPCKHIKEVLRTELEKQYKHDFVEKILESIK